MTNLPSIDVIEDKVQFVRGLEGVVKTDQERMFDILHQNIPLRHDVLSLILSDDVGFVEDFDGINLLFGFVFRYQHLGRGKGENLTCLIRIIIVCSSCIQ